MDGVTAERDRLLAQLREHMTRVRAAANDNEFVDLPRAENLHERLVDALARYEHLDSKGRDVLTDAVAYFARTEDEENDVLSPVGFDDDAEVVAEALRRVSRG